MRDPELQEQMDCILSDQQFEGPPIQESSWIERQALSVRQGMFQEMKRVDR
jgi:hypothetical protein